MLAITQTEKILFAVVESLILLIITLKFFLFTFLVFIHISILLIKFLLYTNNCFTRNFFLFLFKSHYRKLLIKSIKVN